MAMKTIGFASDFIISLQLFIPSYCS